MGCSVRVGAIAMDRCYQAEADRVSKNFLSMVQQEFQRRHDLEEKYDVARRSDDVKNGLRYGYHSNEAGFGWTNAVFTALLDELSPKDQGDVLDRHSRGEKR
jgi:alpha,alpha-trehalase